MTPAANIIEKCGGVSKTAKLIGATENWVYRWRLPKEKGGTGGEVPAPAQRALIRLAREGRVDVKPEDFFEAAS